MNRNNMRFNGDKLECIKIGDSTNLMHQYNYVTPDHGVVIDDVDSLRDHGIIVLVEGDYRVHSFSIVSKAKKKVG